VNPFVERQAPPPRSGHGLRCDDQVPGGRDRPAGPERIESSRQLGRRSASCADLLSGLAGGLFVVCSASGLSDPDGVDEVRWVVQAGSTAVRGPGIQLLTSAAAPSWSGTAGPAARWSPRVVRSAMHPAPWRHTFRGAAPRAEPGGERRAEGPAWPDSPFSVCAARSPGFEAKAGPRTSCSRLKSLSPLQGQGRLGAWQVTGHVRSAAPRSIASLASARSPRCVPKQLGPGVCAGGVVSRRGCPQHTGCRRWPQRALSISAA